MKYKLVLTSLAQIELSEALEYYADKSPSTATRFLNQVDIALNKLEENPQHFSFFGDSQLLGSLALNKFPYAIIFSIKANEVRVVGFHNNYRDTTNILNRT